MHARHPSPITCYLSPVRIAQTQQEMAALTAELGPLVFVPTMGALHEGHGALVEQAAAIARDRSLAGCIVSIFVNPTQFNDPKDFERYPKTLESDAALCERRGAIAIFAPHVHDIYPADNSVTAPQLPNVATLPGLEDAHRPGHFAGVCQVVKRLFDLVRPAAAVFGEKDWQQLQVIRAMTRDLDLGIDIVPGPTVREPDGLAMSSRNRFLAHKDRRQATSLSRALIAASNEPDPRSAERAMLRELIAHGIPASDIEYAVVRDAQSLLAFRESQPGRALIAARVGSVRLIDNHAWVPASR